MDRKSADVTNDRDSNGPKYTLLPTKAGDDSNTISPAESPLFGPKLSEFNHGDHQHPIDVDDQHKRELDHDCEPEQMDVNGSTSIPTTRGRC